MKSAMGSKSLNHFCWIDQLYFCPSPRKARRGAAKKWRAYASCATTLANVALSHKLATQVRARRSGGQAGSAAAAGSAGDTGMSMEAAAGVMPAGTAGGVGDIGMSVRAAA